MIKEQIIIFDTTLRDGEQAAGASMTVAEKLIIAEALDDMAENESFVIEAGFAISSEGELNSIKQISKLAKKATICSLARASKTDIDAAAEAIKDARKGRIHTFISTSPIHMEYKLKMKPEQVLEAIKTSVSYARNFTDDVEWSAEDATRTERDFLFKAIDTAIKAGATTINIPDTVGYTLPQEMEEIIIAVRNNVSDIDKVIISTHCHDDLGLAVANSLSAVKAGARQVECTINAIGERAGNAALEEIVMAIHTRPDLMPYDVGVKTEHITRVSKLVSSITGIIVQPNKAIVGENAFAHESGIHQDGMLKNPQTYEILTPESVGLTASKLPLGKLSGRAAFRDKLKELAVHLDDEAVNKAFKEFKSLADKKKTIYDEDILAIVDSQASIKDDRIKFVKLYYIFLVVLKDKMQI